jgi:hypothetical protein
VKNMVQPDGPQMTIQYDACALHESVGACTTEMSDIMRKKFYGILSDSVKNKKDNNVYLTSEIYNCVLNGVKVAKSVKGKQTVHYRPLKRYDILNIGGEEKLTVSLSAEKTEILYYVTFDELFKVIHEGSHRCWTWWKNPHDQGTESQVQECDCRVYRQAFETT